MLQIIQAALGGLYSRHPWLATAFFWLVWIPFGVAAWYGLMVLPGTKLTGARPGADQSGVGDRPLTGQQQVVKNSPGATIVQGSGNIVVQGRGNVVVQALPPPTARINQVLVEARLTVTIRSEKELPPAEVEFLPVGDANAYLEGPQGSVRLTFVSPVRFRRLEGDRLVVINRFALAAGADLYQQPVDSLANFKVLVVPVVPIVYGDRFETMTLLEASMAVNGQDIWYYSYPLNDAYRHAEGAPIFRLPLDSLGERLRHRDKPPGGRPRG